ncbi:unnamed protein product [Allacma fusca]|uniref:C2 domain-containing protein n=1 Tax=Allacma fusca TaxID=39272 RepID=A0A8J2J4W1_9HEXA|nr:unnamed protein product [Allacma fusca]
MYSKLISFLGIALISLAIADGASPVTISLSARELPISDPFGGKPDPYIVVFYAFGSTGKFEQIGKTAVLSDTQNPNWSDEIKVDNFVPGTSQRLRFEVWDEDVDSDDLLGTVEFFLAELSNAESGRLEKELGIQENGRLIVQNIARQNLTSNKF